MRSITYPGTLATVANRVMTKGRLLSQMLLTTHAVQGWRMCTERSPGGTIKIKAGKWTLMGSSHQPSDSGPEGPGPKQERAFFVFSVFWFFSVWKFNLFPSQVARIYIPS